MKVENSDSIISKKAEQIFLENNPNFKMDSQENIELKQYWENKFLEIYYQFNRIAIEKPQKVSEKKIIINFCDICEKEIYFNLELKIEYLIWFIFAKMGYNSYKVIERTKENQSTKDLIENPITRLFESIETNKFNFYLEFKGNNLVSNKDIPLNRIGLQEGCKIDLKLNNYFIINQFKKIHFIIMTSHGENYDIFAYEDETFYSVIKKLFLRFGRGFNLNDNNFVFLYKAQSLNKHFNKTLQQLKINNNTTIVMCEQHNVIGAGFPPIDFVDVSSKKVTKLNFSEKAPRWRSVKKGLNIFGFCKNSKCIAFKKEVIYPTELNEKLIFNLNEQVTNIRCPICSKIFKPKNCGFWKCEYQFVGKKIEDGEVINYDSETKETKGNDFEYFDAMENGEVVWVELIIYVIPKQKIKFERT